MDRPTEILNPSNLYDRKMSAGDHPERLRVRRISAARSTNRKNSKPGYACTTDGPLNAVYISDPIQRPQDDNQYYEPYDNRIVAHPTTFIETLIHMFKASLGTGVLAMPGAFKDAGWVIGFLGTIFSGIICIHSMHIIIASEYQLCKKKRQPCMSYSETFESAVEEGPQCTRWLSKYVPHFVNTLLVLYTTGTCCIYVVFISSNLKDVADFYLKDNWELEWVMVSMLVPLILLSWVRNLKYLAPLTTLANGLTLASFSIIFFYLFQGLPADLTDRPAFGKLGKLPLFFSTVLFAMEAIGAVMPLENEMKNPRKFGGTFGVLNMAMVPILFLYVLIGFFGYLRYGDDLRETLTLSLPPEKGLAQSAKGMLAVSIMITHALLGYVAFDIVFNEYVQPRIGDNIVVEYIVRTLLVCINVYGAVKVPFLDLFISLMGAVCLSMMGLMIPPLVQLCTYWNDLHGTQFAFLAVKNTAMICVGLFAFFAGAYFSLGEIIQRYKDTT